MRQFVRQLAATAGLGVGTLMAVHAHAAGPKESRPTFVQSTAAADAAAEGRRRMSRHDCAGAIDAFDLALRTSLDPTVQRDRGICHEELGNPYPAIDDYRAYLTLRKDASDADNIRQRLEALEQSTRAGGATHTEGVLAPDWSNQAGIMNSRGLRGSSEVHDSTEARPDAPVVLTRRKDRVEELEEAELLDSDARNSSLRRGSGFVLGPYFQYRAWGVSGVTLGTGYGVGGSFRQSFGQVSTLLLELGYVSYGTNSGSADASSLAIALGDQRNGFGMTLAYEARIRLDARVTNAITLAGGVELNTLRYQTNDTFTTLMGRGRLGYRHIFGPSLGIEVAFDAAQPFYGSGSAVSVTGSNSWETVIIGGYGGLMVGF